MDQKKKKFEYGNEKEWWIVIPKVWKWIFSQNNHWIPKWAGISITTNQTSLTKEEMIIINWIRTVLKILLILL